jgi:hypothetical protein
MVTAIRKTALLNPLPGLSPNPREELGQRVSPHTACCRPMVLLMLSSAAGCAVKATLDVSCGYLHPMRAHLQVEKRSMNKHSGLPHLERTIQRRLIGKHSTRAAISWWVLRWRPVFGGSSMLGKAVRFGRVVRFASFDVGLQKRRTAQKRPSRH